MELRAMARLRLHSTGAGGSRALLLRAPPAITASKNAKSQSWSSRHKIIVAFLLYILVSVICLHHRDMTVHDAQVRGATTDDCETIVDYNLAMAKETEGLDLDRHTVEVGVAALLQDGSKGRYYLVEVGGKRVAQLMITYEWSDWRSAQIWWIQSVFVHPDYRRQGYYRLLYQDVAQAAKSEGACGLRLYADDVNTQAHIVYENLGMTSHYKVYEHMFTAH